MKCRLKAFSYTWILALFGMDSCRILVKKKKTAQGPQNATLHAKLLFPAILSPARFQHDRRICYQQAVDKIRSIRCRIHPLESRPYPRLSLSLPPPRSGIEAKTGIEPGGSIAG